MKPVGQSIFNFKEGDVITRVTASKTKDHSYIGSPFYLLGIANGCIYLEPHMTDDIVDLPFELQMEKMLFGKIGKKQLNLDMWEDGWEIYTDPRKFKSFNDQSSEKLTLGITELDRLKNEYVRALEAEHYEQAEKLAKKIEQIEKKQ